MDAGKHGVLLVACYFVRMINVEKRPVKDDKKEEEKGKIPTEHKESSGTVCSAHTDPGAACLDRHLHILPFL